MGFRRFTEKVAHELGLVGWVRNLRDGRVEAIASGGQEALEKFEVALKEGPRFSHVSEVIRRPIEYGQVLSDFKVAGDGEEPWR